MSLVRLSRVRPTAEHDLRLPMAGMPALPPGWMPRPRLNQRLAAAEHRRLTLVTGSPGAGKTTLLAGWAAERPDGSTAWLGLEGVDNEPSRFWPRFAGALRCIDPAVGSDLLQALDEPRQCTGHEPDLLLADLRAMSPAVLIIDDLQLINNLAITEGVARLVRGLPPHIHLVLASRQAPGFPLHRLRVAGELVEIRDRDLRFTADEAKAFLAMVGDRPLTAEDARALAERTEGWAAGLQLAALALAEEIDASDFAQLFGGHFDLVAEYLEHEVLAGQPRDRVQFLLESSVLERMTGDLCAEVTRRTDAEEILTCLVDRNLFTSKVGSAGGWYRYDRLLGDLLRHRLRHQDPSGLCKAHLRAAHWFERRGEVDEAIHHFVKGGSPEQGFSLGAASVALHLADEPPYRPPSLPGGLPDEYFESDPYRMYALAGALLAVERIADAARCVDRLDRLIEGHPDRTMLQGRSEFLWALRDGCVGDAAGVLTHVSRAREFLGVGDRIRPEVPATPIAAHSWLAGIDAAIPRQLAILAARAHLWLENPAEAHAALTSDIPDRCQSRDVAWLGLLAMVACCQGRLRQAYGTAGLALEEAERQHRSGSPVTLDARLALGVTLWEYDDLDGAYQQFDDARRLCTSMGCTRRFYEVEHHLICTLISQDRSDEAFDRLSRLRAASWRDPLPSHLQLSLDAVEIRCRLALGDLDGAKMTLMSVPHEHRRPEVLARIDLCAGRPDRAAGRLTAAPTGAIPASLEVERLALLARAQVQLGNRRQADDAIRRAIDRSRAERYVRRLIEHATELLPLLKEIAGRYPDMYVAELLDHVKPTDTSAQTAPAPTLEPLTDREREILGHLTGHRTQQEIACGMYVSVNTLKTHINRVYRKLGACSRSQAVALARTHGLL